MTDPTQFLAHHTPPSLGDPSTVLSKRNDPNIAFLLLAIGNPPPTLQQLEIQIPVPNGTWTSRTIVTRLSASRDTALGPLIVLYHGGGFVMGIPDTQLPVACSLAALFNAVVLCPSYRLAPEHKFPVGVNDAYDILRWAGENAASLRADPSKGFIVGGNSAGANFAVMLARRSVEEGLTPKLTGHWAGYPGISDSASEDDEPKEKGIKLLPEAEKYRDIWKMALEQNRDTVLVDVKVAAALFSYYGIEITSPLYNPLTIRSSFDLGNLPMAFVQIGGMDLLRDDGIVYAYALEDAGVDVRLLAYPGVPHVFPAFFLSLQASKEALVDVALGFAWMLGVEIDLKEARKVMVGRS